MKGFSILFVLIVLCFPERELLHLRIVRGRPVVQKLIMAVFGLKGHNITCRLLRDAPQQQMTCRRDHEIRNVLQKAANIAKVHCQEQFRFNAWGCSPLFGNITFVKRARMYRETALLYAMYSSALTHVVARACSEGRLRRCLCTKEGNQSFKWGICGDDLTYGRRFTRRFLQLSHAGMDALGNLVRHNSEVGIQVVAENLQHHCKCHGLSGSCTVRTCWQRLKNFKEVSDQLKNFYHTAMLQTLQNKIRSRILRSMPRQQLFYLEKSPNFCSGTHNRQCQNPANCATLCCGRGYSQHSQIAERTCNCHWQAPCCYYLKCDMCTYVQNTYICK